MSSAVGHARSGSTHGLLAAVVAVLVAVLVLGAAAGGVTGCSELLGPAPGLASPPSTVRDRPDDSNLPALVPDGVVTMVDINMATLRASPWTTAALAPSDARGRAVKVDALGYDDVADIDRIIYAATSAGVDQPTLVIAQGRFQRQRVDDAFRTRWPGATVDKHRQLVLLASGENALAFLTPRTFVSGTPTAVRVVIDRAFGVGTVGATDGVLGPLRRALIPAVNGTVPAVLATVAIDARMRARVGDADMVPRELRQVGVRVDLGQSMDLAALGLLDNHDASAALGRRLAEMLTNPVTRLGARAMGLGPLLDSTRITVDGPRLRIRASATEESRGDVVAALRTLMGSLRGGNGAGGLGSW